MKKSEFWNISFKLDKILEMNNKFEKSPVAPILNIKHVC